MDGHHEHTKILDYLLNFILKALPVTLIELIAALVGTYYLRTNKQLEKNHKYLVYFLWYTFLNEVIGAYAPIAYFTQYKYFGFIENTVFYDNVWMYNIYILISISFYVNFFRVYLSSIKIKKTLTFIVLFYLLINVLNFLLTGVFFKDYSILAITSGTILLLFTIILFYLNLLKSNQIYDLKRYLPFYVSIGVLVLYLCLTPLLTFAKYFNSSNDLYVKLSANIILFSNIIMYSTFIIGFLFCSKSKKENLDVL